MYMIQVLTNADIQLHVHVHDNMRWKERKKERHLRKMKKMKNELRQVGFEPTTLCTPDRCSYQLCYQGSTCTPCRISIFLNVACTCTCNYVL